MEILEWAYDYFCKIFINILMYLGAWLPISILFAVACIALFVWLNFGLCRCFSLWKRDRKAALPYLIPAVLGGLADVFLFSAFVVFNVYEWYQDKLFDATYQVLEKDSVINGFEMPKGTKLKLQGVSDLDDIDLGKFVQVEFPKPVRWRQLEIVEIGLDGSLGDGLYSLRSRSLPSTVAEVDGWQCNAEIIHWIGSQPEKIENSKAYRLEYCDLAGYTRINVDFSDKEPAIYAALVEQNRDAQGIWRWKTRTAYFVDNQYIPLTYADVYWNAEKQPIMLTGSIPDESYANPEITYLSSCGIKVDAVYLWLAKEPDVIRIYQNEHKPLPQMCAGKRVVAVDTNEAWDALKRLYQF